MKKLFGIGVLALVLLLIATACSTGNGEAADSPSDTTSDVTVAAPGGQSAVGPGISVQEALDSNLPGPLLVNGFIITTPDGTVLLAELLAESLPPQPGGATLVIEGLDLATFPGLKTAQGITWSDQLVQVLGEVNDGVLTVSTTVSG